MKKKQPFIRADVTGALVGTCSTSANDVAWNDFAPGFINDEFPLAGRRVWRIVTAIPTVKAHRELNTTEL